jgi:hypothetical protein
MMASTSIRIPGVANLIESRAAALAAAVQQQFDIVTAAPEAKPRPAGAGDLGKPLTTVRRC